MGLCLGLGTTPSFAGTSTMATIPIRDPMRGLGFRVQGSGFRVSGLGFRV